MKKHSNRSMRAWQRALLTAVAGTAITFTQTSCGVGGLLNRNKDDDADSARIASAEPKEKKRKKGSLFNRAKERNSYINDDIQTTRRDRIASRNTANFTTVNAPAPAPAPAPPPAPIRRNDDFASQPRTPAPDLDLDPDPNFRSSPQVTARTGRPEESLRLPTLDSDFPQDYPTQPTEPSPRSRAPRVSNDGYIPLQPRLPGAESIQPPSE